jgi:hypothetical protein
MCAVLAECVLPPPLRGAARVRDGAVAGMALEIADGRAAARWLPWAELVGG